LLKITGKKWSGKVTTGFPPDPNVENCMMFRIVVI
jgi:hypothetical protein